MHEMGQLSPSREFFKKATGVLCTTEGLSLFCTPDNSWAGHKTIKWHFSFLNLWASICALLIPKFLWKSPEIDQPPPPMLDYILEEEMGFHILFLSSPGILLPSLRCRQLYAGSNLFFFMALSFSLVFENITKLFRWAHSFHTHFRLPRLWQSILMNR